MKAKPNLLKKEAWSVLALVKGVEGHRTSIHKGKRD